MGLKVSLEENYYDVNITLGVAYVVDTLNIEAKRIINDKLQLLCDDIDALIFNLGIDLRPILISTFSKKDDKLKIVDKS